MLKNFLKNVTAKFKKKEQVDLYYSYYLFGYYDKQPLWDWSIWKKCMPLLQPVIDLSPETPSINSSQASPVSYGKDNKLVSYNKGAFRFGKMVYKESNNEKWTTKYINEPNWTFFDTEIVFPSFNYCEKQGVDPDIFIKVTNENLNGSLDAEINQSLIILFKTNLINNEKLKVIEQNIEALSTIMNVVLSGKLTRQVQYPAEYGGFTDYIRYGSLGVVDYKIMEFSVRFKKYGMETIKNSLTHK